MSVPQQPQPPQVTRVTHHTIECSWEQQQQQQQQQHTAGRLRAEVQLLQHSDSWEIVYKGYDHRCKCAELQSDTEYKLRLRFGNAHGWGEFSAIGGARTAKKPFSGEDIHKQIRRRNLDELHRVLASKEAQVDAPDDKGFTPLCCAALEGLIEYCDLLLEYKADVNWCSDNGKTPLMLAAYKGKVESVEWLLEHGASLHARDRKGLSCLHFAVDGEQLEAVRLLLDSGADLHAKDNKGCTVLIRCAMHKNNGNAAIAGLLSQRGAGIDETDASGQSALFYCVLNRHERMAGILLNHGADPLATNSKGMSVLQVAEAQHDAKQLRELLGSAASEKRGKARK